MALPKIPTPDTEHVGRGAFASVYVPAEDTFLFLDALAADVAHLQALDPAICLELGYVHARSIVRICSCFTDACELGVVVAASLHSLASCCNTAL
jgi:hypothetical protein